MSKPVVSIVIPVHNGEEYLRETIQSVLGQTYADFELIIVNDGSVDNTLKVIKEFVDERIKIISLGTNKGVEAALNEGIKSARGKYIARLDADDMMTKERLTKQVAYLDSHKDVGVVGSYIRCIPGNNIKKYPRTHALLVLQMQFLSPFCHPATTIRKELLLKYPYDKKRKNMEDLDLWFRLAKKTKFANISQVLTLYRLHDASTTSKNWDSMLHDSLKYRRSHGWIIFKVVYIILLSVPPNLIKKVLFRGKR